MWGIAAPAAFVLQDVQAAVLALIEHGAADCLSIHAAQRGARFEALEGVRRAVRERFGGFAQGMAAAVKLRHDYGP